MRVILALLLLGCGGGSGADAGPDACSVAPPATPGIVDPAEGRIDVVPGAMTVRASSYRGDGPHTATELEIWRNGSRVWVASLGPVESATIAEGTQEAPFEEWEDYVVRARYASGCAWSEWSTPRMFRTDDGSTALFDPSVIHEVHLTIPPESYAAIDAQAVGPWPYVPERDYHTGTLVFQGVTYENVGIRVKGGCGSSRNLHQKAALKVSLSWDDPAVAGCPEERRIGGQKHFTFNNMVQDPSFERERLGYELYRAFGQPAPRAAHVRLFVNGELWGLYLHVESFDRRFLSRFFQDNGGMMYEGGPFCDVIPEQIPPGTGDACFDMEFSNDVCDPPMPGEDPTDWELLRQLANQLAALPPGGFYPEVEAFFDYEQFLENWAVTALISDWDGYQYGNINNYRVYRDPSDDRWRIIQSGIDNSFDSSPGFDFWGVSAILARRCFEEADCTAAFAAKVHAANDLFESMGMAARAEAIQTQIRADIVADPRKEVSADAALTAHQSLVSWISGRPAAVRQSLAEHGF